MAVRVCIVALNAYPAIDPEVSGNFGGIETRSWLLARGLAALEGFEVSFVVRHWQSLRQEKYEGVRLVLMRDRLYPLRDSVLSRLESLPSFPWRRLKQPKWSDLLAIPLLAIRRLFVPRSDPLSPNPAYTGVNADLFLTFGVNSNSAQVIASAHAVRRPAVLFLGSDSDLDERYAAGNSFVSVYRDRSDVCQTVLREADQILCQTRWQKDRLLNLFERKGEIIENPIDLDEWDRLSARPVALPVPSSVARYVLWVGRADPEHKRPRLLLDLARACPEIPFLMIMNPRDDVLDAEIRRTAPPNVTIVTRVPFSDMPAVLKSAAALVNTSSLEGFSNLFLQAAASGVPIVSLEVGKEFLQEAQAGFLAEGDQSKMVDLVRRCWTGPPTPYSAPAARRFVEQHHSLSEQVGRLARALEAAVGAGVRSSENA